MVTGCSSDWAAGMEPGRSELEWPRSHDQSDFLRNDPPFEWGRAPVRDCNDWVGNCVNSLGPHLEQRGMTRGAPKKPTNSKAPTI